MAKKKKKKEGGTKVGNILRSVKALLQGNKERRKRKRAARKSHNPWD